MILALDHLIYWVQDPSDMVATCQAFEQAGFVITDRDDEGREEAPTRQRLICLDDGSYIEILTVCDTTARQNHRLEPLGRQGNGWADYSLFTDDLDCVLDRVLAAGLPVSGPKSHEKKLVDGRPWGVRLINIGVGTGHPAMPFVLQDTVGRNLRIPQTHTRHPNQARATVGVRVIVRDLEAAVASLSIVMGAPTKPESLPAGAAAGHRFQIGKQWVDVFSPKPDDVALGAFLDRRGDSVFSVVLAGASGQNLSLMAAGPFSTTEIVAE
ncbi:VOC family protein [Roseovarius aestuarii]|nr:VOC family protein [Roseovarius aestuarii]